MRIGIGRRVGPVYVWTSRRVSGKWGPGWVLFGSILGCMMLVGFVQEGVNLLSGRDRMDDGVKGPVTSTHVSTEYQLCGSGPISFTCMPPIEGAPPVGSSICIMGPGGSTILNLPCVSVD